MNSYESAYLGSLGFTQAQQQAVMLRAQVASARAQKQAYNRAVRMYQTAVKKGIQATPPPNPFVTGPNPVGLDYGRPESGPLLSGLGDGFFTEYQDHFNLMVYGSLLGAMLWPKEPAKGLAIGFLGGYAAGLAGFLNITGV